MQIVQEEVKVEDIEKAFHTLRVEGARLHREGKISWQSYAFVMAFCEGLLRERGCDF